MSETFPMRVFVYGTLKQGESNHICMVDARASFICRAKTKEYRRMVCAGIPFLHDGHDPEGYQVEGEIYEIPDEAGLRILDGLEGNGTFYKRKPDTFIDTDAGGEVTAWVYYIMRPREGRACRSYTGRVLSAMATFGEGM